VQNKYIYFAEREKFIQRSERKYLKYLSGYPANRLTSKKRWKSLVERKLICTFAPAFSENPMHLTM